MKRKRFKIDRYEYEWGGQRKLWWKRVLSTSLVVVAAAVVGWMGYEPVYNWVVGLPQGNHPPAVSSQPEQLPESSSSQSTAPEVLPAPAEEHEMTALYYLPNDVITSPDRLATQLGTIKSMGGTGVVFDLKDDKGMVLYRSALPEVEQYLVQGEVTYSLTDTIAAIKAAGLAPVGRLFAFRDSKATSATAMVDAGVKYKDSKINWLDNSPANGGKAWLNPNSATARDYVLSLVNEVAGMGLDIIIMDGVQFPTGLSLHLANYGGEPNRSQVLADFLTAAASKAAGYDAKIYPVIALDSAAGLDIIKYGNEPALLAAAAGNCMLDVRPEQFGVGVVTESLTLSKPLQTPYESLTTALAATKELIPEEGHSYGAMVQCYTAGGIDATANMTYTKTEIDAQVRAAQEAGLKNILYYNPQGSY